jgi:outer membrane lipoprotein-sorting protein
MTNADRCLIANLFSRHLRSDIQTRLWQFKKIVFLFGLMIFVHNPCLAQEPVPTSAEVQHLIFQEISRAVSGVETIVSDFSQEKHVSMLKDTLISAGRLYYQKPDRLRWEITRPTYFGFIINGKRAIRWKGEHTPSEVFELDKSPAISRFVHQLFAWIKADFSRIRTLYRIRIRSTTPTALILNPLGEKEKKIINHILIVFSMDFRHVETFEIHEADGDFTRIRFLNTRINLSLKKELF